MIEVLENLFLDRESCEEESGFECGHWRVVGAV